MNNQNRPRVGQTIGTVSNEGNGLVAKMSLWLQQYLSSVGLNPDNAIAVQTVGASPFTYTNSGDYSLDALVTSGTVSLIEFIRSGIVVPVAAATNQTVTLNPGDAVRVTYSVLPILRVIPR